MLGRISIIFAFSLGLFAGCANREVLTSGSTPGFLEVSEHNNTNGPVGITNVVAAPPENFPFDPSDPWVGEWVSHQVDSDLPEWQGIQEVHLNVYRRLWLLPALNYCTELLAEFRQGASRQTTLPYPIYVTEDELWFDFHKEPHFKYRLTGDDLWLEGIQPKSKMSGSLRIHLVRSSHRPATPQSESWLEMVYGRAIANVIHQPLATAKLRPPDEKIKNYDPFRDWTTPSVRLTNDSSAWVGEWESDAIQSNFEEWIRAERVHLSVYGTASNWMRFDGYRPLVAEIYADEVDGTCRNEPDNYPLNLKGDELWLGFPDAMVLKYKISDKELWLNCVFRNNDSYLRIHFVLRSRKPAGPRFPEVIRMVYGEDMLTAIQKPEVQLGK